MSTISWIFLVIIVFQAAVGIRNTLRMGYYRKTISEMSVKLIEAIAVIEGYREELGKYRKENKNEDSN
ncbi:MAG: hypothetical protein J6Y02_02230 [Pseudobutyrivibrio sp.]|nr:hypothetical protein [Pseudobutyrivibrio sp.]